MSNFSDITTIILAGGLGTRIRELVSDRPKVLAEIKGKPFIFQLLNQLASLNVKEVIISTGYMADEVEKALGPNYNGLKLQYSKEEKPLGTAGALRLASVRINSPECLIMNGDSFVEFELDALCSFHIKKNAGITMLVKKIDDIKRFGVVELNSNNEIIRFIEKGSLVGKGFINAGVYLMESELINTIPLKMPCSLEYDFFPMKVSKSLFAHEVSGRFIDIGTHESFYEANKFFETIKL